MRQKSFRRLIAYSSIAHPGISSLPPRRGPTRRGGAVLRARLRVLNLLAFAALPPARRRRGPRSPRQLPRTLPPGAVRRRADRDGVMLSLAGHPAVPGLSSPEFLDLQGRDRRRLHALRGARPRRRHLGIYFICA
ncbi:MAG: hypothetical protein IPJ62_14855 [Betaproteobacteria bacterium]|nr:hypothetical protein [Betaproteobacteria bacterium]